MKDSGHIQKITAIYSLRTVAISSVGDSLAERIVGVILKCLNDPVPNVRMVGVKTLRDIARRYETTQLKDQIKKYISSMPEDQDKDVKYYCMETMNTL